jgi:glycosyltransferase involved in cell wall biosynthesis
MITASVVVPCFNARKWIGATLSSVLDQRPVDLEIIVVDDGSTDGSADLVASEFPTVKVIGTERRSGPSGARNLGTRLATGAFIQYVDADDLLAAHKLEQQLRVLEETSADVAYGDWQELRADSRGSYQPGRIVARRIEGPPDIALFTDFWCPPVVYLFRRAMVDRVGPWNEWLPIVQDARFVLDCALHGARFVYCPGVAGYYRVHESGSVSTTNRAEFVRDRLRNAASVEERWVRRGQLTPARVQALVKVYGQVARDCFRRDETSFEEALNALERLRPGYVPTDPWHLSLASRLVGYRRAEALAVYYRRAKAIVRRAARPLTHARR